MAQAGRARAASLSVVCKIYERPPVELGNGGESAMPNIN